MEQPFNYVFTGRFTNRKHRQIDSTITVMPDAPFKLRGVMFYTAAGPVLLRLEDISPSMLPTENMGMDKYPFPIFPEMLFKQRSEIRFSVKLPSDTNIGRKRPKFQLMLIGTKVYDVPGTSTSVYSLLPSPVLP